VLCPLDQVNRQFKAQRPNQLWVSEFTYVLRWEGVVYVAFILYRHLCRDIVGWQVISSTRTDIVLDMPKQTLYPRQLEQNARVHPSDRRFQYILINYSERLAMTKIELLMDSKGTVATFWNNCDV